MTRTSLVVLLVAFMIGCVSESEKTYRIALKHINQKQWLQAHEELLKVEDYKDAKEKLKEVDFYYYLDLADESNAIRAFGSAASYLTKAPKGFNDTLLLLKLKETEFLINVDMGDILLNKDYEATNYILAELYYKQARTGFNDSLVDSKLAELSRRKEAREKTKLLNAPRIANLKSQMKISHDDVKNITWYKDKTVRTFECIYVYFGQINNNITPLRLVLEYYGENWIFFNNVTFNIDGDIKTLKFEPKRDNSGGSVWETVDVAMTPEYLELVKDIANSKNTKFRFGGDRIADKTVTDVQKKAIQRVLELYDLVK